MGENHVNLLWCFLPLALGITANIEAIDTEWWVSVAMGGSLAVIVVDYRDGLRRNVLSRE